MEKILCLIMTSHKRIQHINNILNTWAKDIDCIFYSDHQLDIILKVTDRDDYLSNEIKTINIINQLPEKYLEFDWYLFCDDDTFVNTKLLKENINNFDKNEVVGSMMNYWPNDRSIYYLSGGAGFLMHKNIYLKIRNNISIYNTGYNDVSLGIFYRNNNIKIADSKLFNSQPPDTYSISDVHNFITFHYIKTFEDMNNLYLKCKSNETDK